MKGGQKVKMEKLVGGRGQVGSNKRKTRRSERQQMVASGCGVEHLPGVGCCWKWTGTQAHPCEPLFGLAMASFLGGPRQAYMSSNSACRKALSSS